MNRIFLSLLAACRTRSSALGTPSRPCVRGMFCWRGFPLASPLPSIPSADRSPGLVRGLRWYYGSVRLPVPVHHRRTSLDFPMRPTASSAAGGHGISRFSRKVFPCMHGVSDRAGSRASRDIDAPGVAFRLSLQRRHPGGWFFRGSIPGLHVPLSTLRRSPLQTAPHDSGPVWVANPSPYDSFIHYTLPV